MPKIKILIVLCVLGMLLGSGCASVRVLTDLKPKTDPKLQSAAGMFYISGLKYRYEGCVRKGQSDGDIDIAYENNLLLHLRKECPARYPLLFTEEKSAIPLYVTLRDVVDIHNQKRGAWIICTLMITPLILPLPFEVEHALTVSANACKGADDQGSAGVQTKFHRDVRGWLSIFTPLGLIDVPGESDFPKESTTGEKEPLLLRWDFDYKQVAQQMATALAEMVASKEPEFWTTQPRLNSPTIGLPVRTGEAPVAPPVPTDSPTPF